MRRFLLLLLALLLPFQFSWAAAAAYCGHEGPDAPWHIGHHVHHHEIGAGKVAIEKVAAKASTDKSKGDVKVAAFDNDCSFCHAALQPLVNPPDAFTPPVQRGDTIAPSPRAAFTSLSPRAPERPQWSRLA